MNDSIFDSLTFFAPHLVDGAQITANYVMVRCPYHSGGQERTPSMSISLLDPVFHCHACKESGHISKLFKHFGASKDLIDRALAAAGMRDAKKAAKGPQFDAPLAVPISVAEITDDDLEPGAGRAYILNEAILDEYRLAPKQYIKDGFHKSTLRWFGVGVDLENGRFTFPIRDYDGNLLGISGRTYTGQEPRYKIYRSELIRRREFGIPRDYSLDSVKSKLLWNGHQAFKHVKEGHELVIVEGFKAAMWVWQSGHPAVVAIIGSYLSEDHADRLCRVVDSVTLFLDNDDAGIRGTEKAIKTLLKKGLDVWVARYPDDEVEITESGDAELKRFSQPDDIKEPEAVLKAINERESYLAWQLRMTEET